MRCPLCDRPHVDAQRICTCGYDLRHDDAQLAIARLSDEVRAAHRMWLGGLGLLIVAPALLFGGLSLSLTLLGGVVATAACTLVSLGIVRGDHAKRQLVEARARTSLPPARLV
ncbi:MAG TPA: hypothetical protein VFQ53_29580 [Kofleriaceae bacterium]|nr:hypothetical protein [Kofleriaceae bacterium]